MEHRTRKRLVRMAPIGIAAITLFIVVGGVLVRFLWNWLLPPLFNWPAITFLQALGLLLLCRILFGGLGRHGGRRFGPRMGRWNHMTDEERSRFRQRMHERWGMDEPAGGAPPPVA